MSNENRIVSESSDHQFGFLSEHTPSGLDILLSQIFTTAGQTLYFMSFIVLLFFSAILVLLTRASGRYLIASGLIIFIFHGIISHPFIYRLPYTLSKASADIFVPAISLFLFVIGFSRLVIWVKKANKLIQPSNNASAD